MILEITNDKTIAKTNHPEESLKLIDFEHPETLKCCLNPSLNYVGKIPS